MSDQKIIIHIKDDGLSYETDDFSVEEVVFWLNAIVDGIFRKVFDPSNQQG